ncbi:MAG: CDP-diacylglycerol--glycerol-3-phosphate 3-phosphatidyltransferase [Phycisphaerales bacterium]|nr:CDP-diacylglycerol--glycerol-3-phosphate 3-phosphatidyltransferase [Phycisphaerales bacterium]
MPDDGRPTWQRQLPNALTFARLLLAIALFTLLSVPAAGPGDRVRLALALALFVAAAVTDALDGHLARRWQVVSVLGRVMDPFADKLLILGSFILLAGPGFVTPGGHVMTGVAPWMAVAVLGRELLVTTIRGAYEARGVDFSASWSGKIKMILQSVAIPLILLAVIGHLGLPADSDDARSLRLGAAVLAWITVLVTLWSAVPYIQRAISASSGVTED